MRRILFSFVVPALLALGCGKKEEGAEKTASATAIPKESQDIFTNRCVACHGVRGSGDGPASASLSPKPRNFQDRAWQKSVTDEHIEKIIVGGGAAVGKSPAMPGNPDLAGKPEVVTGLKNKVRSLAAK
jgi:mono/diheme cytochrome c family protein